MAALPAQPVPQRMPPLKWRGPAFLWTPAALGLAIGVPALLFGSNEGQQRLALVAGTCVFILALIALGVSWAIGFAPRTRRTVVMHVVWSGAAISLLAPFVLTDLMATVAGAAHAGEHFTFSMSLAMIPLALVLGLPLSLVSGLIFAWTAFEPPRPRKHSEVMIERADVQPFK